MEPKRRVCSVADLSRRVRKMLENSIGRLWVEGELSRLVIHSSGHWYFTLKDERAAVSCVMFARENASILFHPADGIKVQAFVLPSLYEISGRYQFIVFDMEERGKGSLHERFEKLKEKLAKEGLFEEERKKPLPFLPKKIAVLTSPTGAAVRDIIHVLIRRFPNIIILLIPVRVQGSGAEQGIAKAIDYLNTRGDIDLMIVGRGGGSIEDLWSFNEEVVARSIDRSDIPVITAIGHEIDFTIADFVADVRAPTPSAAAELAVREKSELEHHVALFQRRLNQSLKNTGQNFRIRLNRAANSYVFRRPNELLYQRYRQHVLSMKTRMKYLFKLAAQQKLQYLERFNIRMAHLLHSGIQQTHQRIDELGIVMRQRMERAVETERQNLERLQSQMGMLNPLAVLGRGYSLTRRPDGMVVRSLSDIGEGDSMVTQLADGKIVSNVSEKAASSPLGERSYG